MTVPHDLIDGVEVPLAGDALADFEARNAANAAAAGERLKTKILAATQDQLDSFARTRSYDGILSACTYATDPNPVFSAEGQYCVVLRGQTWAALYQMLDEVEAGTREIPASFEDIASELPTATAEWP